MFTGIIEEIGKVYSINAYDLTVECNKVLENSNIGDSISTSGVCLTIIKIKNNKITFDLSEETINKTFFGKEQEISYLNYIT